ncbi:MAG: SMP-30/gluconolactonase/LRE family protein [Candidatus Competibacterales bacterium]
MAPSTPTIIAGPVRCVLDARAQLGECPRWDEVNQRLYWVDIDGFRLHGFDPATKALETLQLTEEIGCFALTQGGDFIAALRSGFCRIASLQGGLTPLPSPDYDRTTTRFNDGRCDPKGRFWAGTLYAPKDHPGGGWYCLEADGTFRRRGRAVTTANGLAFDQRGAYLYYADTPEHVVYRCAFDLATGDVGEPTVFHRFPRGQGRPDGAAVDGEGHYWSALYAGGRIVRLDPQGQQVAEIAVPAPYPTMVAFGGADLKTLFITTARGRCTPDELARYPQSGGLFAVEVAVAGLAEPRFAG